VASDLLLLTYIKPFQHFPLDRSTSAVALKRKTKMALRQGLFRENTTGKPKLQEATAANVASPKGISKKTPGASPEKPIGGDHTLGLQRRRLSVVSDNKLVEGMTQVTTNDVDYVEDGTSAIGSYAGLSKKGYAPYNPRKKNQDSMIIKHDPVTKSLLLCVFDGHGEAGDAVSGFIRDRFPTELFKHPKFAATGNVNVDAQNIRVAIGDSLNAVEKAIIRDPSVETEFSGTTAVVSVIRENLLVVGNVGDSRIIRGFVSHANPNAIVSESVSIDHKPDRPDEKARILATGGRVFAVEYDDGIDGPPRVWLGHMDVPGLAMSRSLGDGVAHTAGVSSEPEYFSRILDSNDRCLVIATDGLWEFMSNEEVTDIVAGQKDPKVAVDLLIMEANRRWMKEEQVIDDTTVIVAYVNTTDSISGVNASAIAAVGSPPSASAPGSVVSETPSPVEG
jgi:serine/threonine protein phosphatase PrpC